MHAHKRFTVATKVQCASVIRAVPGSAAQTARSRFLLGSTDAADRWCSRISQNYLNAIALRLNQRPRKIVRIMAMDREALFPSFRGAAVLICEQKRDAPGAAA
jgi:hypothetical protein